MKNLCFAIILAGIVFFIAGCGNNGDDKTTNENTYCNYPLVPSNISASAQSSSSIEISWNLVSGANNYNIYRATSASGTYSYINNTTGTSFIDVDLSSSTTYYYKIAAENSCGESAMSSYISAETNCANPSAPNGVYASAQTSSSIEISWNSVSGASSYNIYRSSMSAAVTYSYAYSYVGNSSSTSYTNTDLSSSTTYYYKVTAENDCGEGAMSSYVSATTEKICLLPAAPTISGVSKQTSSSIKVSWNSVSGASSYKVYRATSANGTYSHIGNATTTSYTNTGLSLSSTIYHYKITAVNSCGESEFSNIYGYDGTGANNNNNNNCVTPSVPTGVTAFEGYNSVTVSWNGVYGVSYEVQCKRKSYHIKDGFRNVFYESNWDTCVSSTEKSSVFFNNRQICEAGQTTGCDVRNQYLFRVKARNSCGSSDFSSTVSVGGP